jgi:hypothetical protein
MVLNRANLTAIFAFLLLAIPAIALGQEADVSDESSEQAEQAPADNPEPELSAEEQANEDEQQPTPEEVDADRAETDRELATDLDEAEAETEPAEGEAAETEEEQEEEESSLPWRNSTFLWDHAISTATLDPSAGRSYNPFYAWTFSLRPRWYFTDNFYLGLRQDLAYELTDADSGAANHRPELADTRLDVGYSKFIDQDWFTLGGTIRMTFPTSIASQAYEKVLGIGPTLAAAASFPEVANGIEFGLGSTYAYTFATANSARREESEYGQNLAGGGQTDPGDSSASFVGRLEHAGTVVLSVDFSPIERLGLSSSFTWWWQSGLDLDSDPITVPCDSCPGGVRTLDTEATNMRLSTWFTLGVNYDVVDWLNLEAYYSHLTSEFSEADAETGERSRRNPFWSIDSQVGVTATLSLDGLYTEIASDAEEEEERPTVARSQSRRTAQ